MQQEQDMRAETQTAWKDTALAEASVQAPMQKAAELDTADLEEEQTLLLLMAELSMALQCSR